MKLLIFILSTLISLSVGHEGHDHKHEHNHNENKIVKAFSEQRIVPDVLSSPPEHLIEIKYPKSGKVVNLGNELAPVEVRERPEVKFDANPNDYYTLIFVDPDAPSRAEPTRREFRHWLKVNIPGSDLSKGEDLNAYIGSAPPKDSGLHRYIFLLYKQPRKLHFKEKVLSDNEIGDRPKSSAKKFAEEYHLELTAGNFYQAQYDDSVPELHKKLGINPPKRH